MNNLVVGLVTAALGFALTLVRDSRVLCNPGYGAMIWLSIVLLLVSGAAGLWCAMNRLQDFRATAQIAKGDMTSDQVMTARCETDRLGKNTWTLLRLQVGAFASGVLALVIGVVLRSLRG